MMKASNSAIELIKKFEGCRLTSYADSVGVMTIGYGHIDGVKKGQRISQQKADQFLAQDVEIAANEVSRLVTAEINQNQFDALVSFTFNLGAKNLAESTLLRNVNSGNFRSAADQFGRWVFAGGVLIKGLVNRREAERQLFVS